MKAFEHPQDAQRHLPELALGQEKDFGLQSLSHVIFSEVRGMLQRLKMSLQVAFSVADMLFVIVKAQITAISSHLCLSAENHMHILGRKVQGGIIYSRQKSLRVPNLWLVLLQP